MPRLPGHRAHFAGAHASHPEGTLRDDPPDARRRVASRLQNEALAKKLFEDIAPRFAQRPGGYTRIVKLARFRVGDASQLCRLELVEKKEKEKKEKGKKK